MALDFVMSGGNFIDSFGVSAPGVWGLTQDAVINSSIPSLPGSADTFAFQPSGGGTPLLLRTPNLGVNFVGLMAGYRYYLTSLVGATLITFMDAGALDQCDLRINGSGQFYFTRNGTIIGGTSSYALVAGTWAYIEFKAMLSASGGGTCEVRVNGVTVLTSTGLTNASTTGLYIYGATAALVQFSTPYGTNAYLRDFYVVDPSASSVVLGTITSGAFTYGETLNQATSLATATLIGALPGRLLVAAVSGAPDASHTWTGASSGAVFTPTFIPTAAATSYLGDVNIVEVYPDGPGVNSAWTANVGPFAVTNVSGSGSSWTFTGAWAGGASNAYVGYNFNTSSCGSGNNQTGVACTASAAGSITLSFSGGSNQSGLSGTAAFECLVEIGINKTGTRPNGDVAYIYDSTSGDISDFAHQSLNTALGHTFSGIILGVAHLSYMRKDDLGTRQVAQVCISSGVTALSGSESLSNTYNYWVQIIEADPNTLTQWGASGFNSATFGVKELT